MSIRTIVTRLQADVAPFVNGMRTAARETQNWARGNERAVRQASQAQDAAARAQTQALSRVRAARRLVDMAQASGDKAAIAAARARLNATQNAANAASRQAAAARRATQEALAQQRALKDAQQRAGQAAAAFGVVAAGGLLASVKSAANFEQSMSFVQAATHESAAAMGQLRDAALDAGARTSFSATEAAGAIEELSKAGVSTAAILGGGLNGALDLAAAGGLAVGEAAETAATAMTQFKLSGKDVPHIADLLAAGAGKAQGSVSDMGAALKQVGLVAAGTGLSLEETVGGLAAFASAGNVGSDAGTSFKSALQSLIPNSEQAGKLMGALGISAYDAQGEFVGLANYAGLLQGALKDMSTEQRDATLKTIFGADGIRYARVLYEQGADGIHKWTDAVNDQGYAAETAAIRMNNLKGDLEQLRGALETAFIGTGDGGIDPLRGLTQSVTSLVNAYNGLPAPAKAATFQIGAMAGAAGLAAGTALLLVPRIADTVAAMTALYRSGPKAAAAMRGLGAAAGGMVALVVVAAGIRAIAAATDEAMPGVDELTGKLLHLSDASTTSALGAQFEDLGKSLARITDKDFGQKLGDALQTPFEGLFGEGAGLRRAKQDLDALDEALSNLAAQGGADVARDKFFELTRTWQLSASQVDALRKQLPGYNDALANSANAAELAATGQGRMGSAMAGASDAAKDERTAAERLKAAIDGLSGSAVDTTRAQIDFKDQLAGIGTAFKENGRSVSLNTAKGRENLGVVLDAIDAASSYGQAVADQSNDVEAGRKAYAGQIEDLRQVLRDAHLTEGQIDSLIAKYGKVPSKAETEVVASGVSAAQQKVDDLITSLSGIPSQKDVRIAIRLTGNTNLAEVRRALGKQSAPAMGRADGGILLGPFVGPKADNVVYAGTPGEFVQQYAAVQHYGVGAMDAINQRRVPKEALLGYANGGLIAGYAKGGKVRPATPNQILGQIGSAAQAALAPNATSDAVSKAARDVERLAKAWQDANDKLDAAKDKAKLVGDVAGAKRALAKAKPADKADARKDLSEAKKALAEYNAEATRNAQQRAIEAKQARVAAALNIADNKTSYEFEHLTTEQQLENVTKRQGGERKYSDAWMDLARQREQLESSLADKRQQAIDSAHSQVETERQDLASALSSVNALLDERDRITGELAQAQTTYDDAVKSANAALAQQTAQIVAARRESLSTFDLTKKATAGSAVSVASLLRNASSQVETFTGWMEQLDLARKNGVSQSLIDSLGLDDGPEALAQLRKLNAAAPGEIDKLNSLVGQRLSLAGTQAGREQTGMLGNVGAQIGAAQTEAATAIAAASGQLTADTTRLNGELSAIGSNTGRDYTTAMAQALASGIPGITAAAGQLQTAMGDALTAEVTWRTLAGPNAQFADGGRITGPGGPRDDKVLLWGSPGEFMVNARSYAKYKPLVEAINADRLPVSKFAGGGYVSASRIPTSQAGGGPMSVNVDNVAVQYEVRRAAEAIREQTDVIRRKGGDRPLGAAPASW